MKNFVGSTKQIFCGLLLMASCLQAFAKAPGSAIDSLSVDQNVVLATVSAMANVAVTQAAKPPSNSADDASDTTGLINTKAGDPEPNKTNSSPKPTALPDIVKCCPLASITLQQASSARSLKNEALPLPENAAAAYMRSTGIYYAEPMPSVPSLRLHHPSSVYYRPLYFEDPNLERCGTSYGIATELVSAVRFFGRAPLIPYMVGSQDPHQCVASLGDCNTCQRYGKTAYLPKLNAKGIAYETAAILSLVFLLP